MHVRIETGYRSGFSDPEANRLVERLNEVHPALGEKIRWVRRLKVFWVYLDAPRDRVVQAIQTVFRNSVTEWLFTGDLVPSAAGATGTLADLMQESPFRPGVFHGIEKRKRVSTHDEEANIAVEVLQTVLGRALPSDRVVTGELLIVEGAALTSQDLEWIARSWFAHESFESWSLLSEVELKQNGRFQAEQVAQYLSVPEEKVQSRLLQFRKKTNRQSNGLDWSRVTEVLRRPAQVDQGGHTFKGDEFLVWPEIHFSSSALGKETQRVTESSLAGNQLRYACEGFESRMQAVLSVLPDRQQLWRESSPWIHPERIHDEFEFGLNRVSETTGVPLVHMKSFENTQETVPPYFWTASFAMGDLSLKVKEVKGRVAELLFVGNQNSTSFQDLYFTAQFKATLDRCRESGAIDFAVPTSGMTLAQALKSGEFALKYGFDLVVDGFEDWFSQHCDQALPLSAVWGVERSHMEFVVDELKSRSIPFLHLGTTSLNGEFRVLCGGQTKIKMPSFEFFKKDSSASEHVAFNEIQETEERPERSSKFKSRFAVEELLLKPEKYQGCVASPVVIRPKKNSWHGYMVLSDLCGPEFSGDHLEYLFRKCTALSGQIHSIQVSMVNGTHDWVKVVNQLESDFGIEATQFESLILPEVKGSWLALQVVSRVGDIRSIRSEDFKQANDRIYWLPGNFGEVSTRWLAGFEGRYQGSIRSAVAIEVGNGDAGVVDTLTYALLKNRLGAEVKIGTVDSEGFFVTVGENEHFAVEEEWRVLEVPYEWVGHVTSTPFLVTRDDRGKSRTISIEDRV